MMSQTQSHLLHQVQEEHEYQGNATNTDHRLNYGSRITMYRNSKIMPQQQPHLDREKHIRQGNAKMQLTDQTM